MRSIKRFLAITLIALVVGLGTPAAFAQGTAESPGIQAGSTTTTEGDQKTEAKVTAEGTAESPGYLGTAESPGFMATFLIYLDVII
jgi:hypothetical protein